MQQERRMATRVHCARPVLFLQSTKSGQRDRHLQRAVHANGRQDANKVKVDV